MNRRFFGLLATLALLVATSAGCGETADDVVERAVEEAMEEEGIDANVQIDDEGSISIESDEGSIQIGGGEVPEDFPFPLPADAVVISSFSQDTEDETNQSVTVTFDSGGFDDVVAMYENYLDDEGFEVSRSDLTAEGDRTIMLTASGDGSEASVVLAYSDDEEEASCQIYWIGSK